MAHFLTEIETPASLSSAFEYVVNFSNTRHWDPTVVRAKKRSRGMVQVGSRFEVVVSMLGQELEFEYEVVSLERSRRIVLEAETSHLRSLDTIEFEPTRVGCRVRYDADLRLKGAAYLFDPAAHVLFQWSGARSARGLSEALDALAPVD